MHLLKVLPLLFLCLGSWAGAQPGPEGSFPSRDPNPRRLVAKVRSAPTTAEDVHQRFRMLMGLVEFDERPLSEEEEWRLGQIQKRLRRGDLTQAAHLVDSVILDWWGEPQAEGLGTPRMLSQPVVSRPIERSVPWAESAPALTVAAKPQGLPWLVWACAAAGFLVLAAVGIFFVFFRKPRLPQPAVAVPAKTLAEKYSLVRVIASGGMGEVYEGRDLSLNRRVAVKRMLPHLKLDADLRAQFLKEARTVAKLSHPYIIPIHDCLESAGELYLVFEYVEGETLARRLQREARLSLKESRRILDTVCQAVDYAHQRHILHRDLKPANIMLGIGGIARVMDFGIALESTITLAHPGSATLDASGTLRYMPPEQHYGASVRASDVYALGVCLYEMVTGHPPFAAAGVEELIAMKRARRYPPPSTLHGELPKELDLFLAAVLSPDPQKRVSSATEFREMLNGLPV